jgi:hypothetical protein
MTIACEDHMEALGFAVENLRQLGISGTDIMRRSIALCGGRVIIIRDLKPSGFICCEADQNCLWSVIKPEIGLQAHS